MPSHLSQSAKNLISRLLQKNPCNRMHLHEVLSHPFLAEDEAITEKVCIIHFMFYFHDVNYKIFCSQITEMDKL